MKHYKIIFMIALLMATALTLTLSYYSSINEPILRSELANYDINERTIVFTVHNKLNNTIIFSSHGLNCWFEYEVDGKWTKKDVPPNLLFLAIAKSLQPHQHTEIYIDLCDFQGGDTWLHGNYRFVLNYTQDNKGDELYPEPCFVVSNAFILS